MVGVATFSDLFGAFQRAQRGALNACSSATLQVGVIDDDFEQTRQPGPESLRGPERVFPALTIACHPNPARIGHRVLLTRCALGGGVVELSRLEPELTDPATGARSPLSDPFFSRRPSISFKGHGAGLLLLREHPQVELLLDGSPIEAEAVLSAEQLDRGAVLELAGRHVLIVHRAGPRGDTARHGLVGESDSMVRLRAEIDEIAPLDVKVLIRGETGSGKEVIAQAIHAASARSEKPLVSVNMAAVQASLASSTLFGHVKGAFSGATSDHLGYFREGNGGTLFLDEVGECPADVQPMLLRALETGEIQPVGSARSFQVDTRVISATDADLEGAAADGKFREPLLHRLAECVIHVPPLRARREDVGRLLLHFLLHDLDGLGALDKLDPGTLEKPWLSAKVVARLAQHDWPGNVRQLRNVARQLAIAGRNEKRLRLTPAIETELSRGLGERHSVPEAISSESPPPSGVEHDRPAPPRAKNRRLEDISEDELIAALKANGWKREAAAQALGISRTSIYELISKSTRIKKASELLTAEIEATRAACGGNLRQMANELGVSERGLKLRMRELGI